MLINLFIIYVAASCGLCVMAQHNAEKSWGLFTIIMMLCISPVIAVVYIMFLLCHLIYIVLKFVVQISWLWIKIFFKYIKTCLSFIIYKIKNRKPKDRPLYICDPDKNTKCTKHGCIDGYCNLTFDKRFSVDGIVVGTELGGPINKEVSSSI